MILDVHRRHFHKAAEELRNVLLRAGVPLNTLSLIETALALCVDCRRWKAPGSASKISLSIANRFGENLLADILFYDDWMFAVFVDECLRWTEFVYTDYKDFHSLEQAYCRDKESVWASEVYGVWCEAQGIKRHLISAKDDKTRLGVINRKCLTFRRVVGPLIANLSHELIEIEPEDIAAELTICVNTQQSYGGHTAYQMLYRQEPHSIINDLEEPGVAPTADGTLPFFRYAKVRHEARPTATHRNHA